MRDFQSSRFRVYFSAVAFVGFAASSALILPACSQFAPAEEENAAPNTGSLAIENQLGDLTSSDLVVGQDAFVSSERLRLRSSPEVTDDNVSGVVEQNDQLKVLSRTPVGEQKFIPVQVIKTGTETPTDRTMFAPAAYLSHAVARASTKDASVGSLTVVINVATNRARVYRKCGPSEPCTNRLIFEDDTVNGEDMDGRRTNLGSYRLDSWTKFYFVAGEYSPWYTAGMPVPFKGDGNDNKPNGIMNGPFGWYTAKVAPNGTGEWFHGTRGWGSAKKKYINFRNTLFGKIAHVFTQIDSHGCTRLDNESIAFMRSLLPIGTRYLKVYAKEALRDSSRALYNKDPHTFEYILTTVGAQQTKNQSADKATVLASGTPKSQWIEEGTLTYTAYPTVKKGDLYSIGLDKLRGVFYVDDGSFEGYAHPVDAKIGYGGYYENGHPSQLPSAVLMQQQAQKPVAVPEASGRTHPAAQDEVDSLI
jgi:hypothetical protein